MVHLCPALHRSRRDFHRQSHHLTRNLHPQRNHSRRRRTELHAGRPDDFQRQYGHGRVHTGRHRPLDLHNHFRRHTSERNRQQGGLLAFAQSRRDGQFGIESHFRFPDPQRGDPEHERLQWLRRSIGCIRLVGYRNDHDARQCQPERQNQLRPDVRSRSRSHHHASFDLQRRNPFLPALPERRCRNGR